MYKDLVLLGVFQGEEETEKRRGQEGEKETEGLVID